MPNAYVKIVNHILRMAATRAKARALRDFTNVGMTCLEELGDMDDVAGDNEKADNGKSRKASARKAEESVSKPAQQIDDKNAVGSTRTAAGQETQKNENAASKPANGNGSSQTMSNQKEDLPEKPSVAQLRAIENLCKRRSISAEDLEEMAKQQFGASFNNITASEASNFIRFLQQQSA